MSKQKKPGFGFRLWIGILIVLLLGAIALLIYGASTNGVREIRIPGGLRMARALWSALC